VEEETATETVRLFIMTERHNTVVCVFDKSSPRISVYDIHEWIYATLQFPEDDVQMVQIGGPTRQVCIKFESAERMSNHLPTILGTREYLHNNGELSNVIVTPTCIGFREVRIASLPPEVTDAATHTALETFGEIRGISGQTWTQLYRYKKSNGVRLVNIHLKRHIPSQMNIAGTRTLVT
jgi:hypothetical protein